MNKKELVECIAEAATIGKTDAEKALNGTLKAIADTLKKGDKVTLVDKREQVRRRRNTDARKRALVDDVRGLGQNRAADALWHQIPHQHSNLQLQHLTR